jgi:hypothetical protein
MWRGDSLRAKYHEKMRLQFKPPNRVTENRAKH